MFMEYVKSQAAGKNRTPEEWIQGIIQRIPVCTLATHAGKFTHPSSKNVDINDRSKPLEMPYVVTDNTRHPTDIVVNAAYLGTAKFLLYELEDGKTVLHHLQEEDKQLQQDLEQLGIFYKDILAMVDAISHRTQPAQTNGYIKQVYFPISSTAYHLVSVLPSSSLMIEVKKRIKEENDQRKKCCDKKSNLYGKPYQRWIDLTDVHFGGTKPQNISTLNSNYGGCFWMLSSLPPTIRNNKMRIPKKDFFRETLPYKEYVPLFIALHRDIITNKKHTMYIRKKREEIMDCIMQLAWKYCYMLRKEPKGWSLQEVYTNLPQAQKIWLDEVYAAQRKDNETWSNELQTQFGRWVLNQYSRILGKSKVLLGDDELIYVKKIMQNVIRKDVRED